MTTCGYMCPLCEGSGLNEQAEPCEWCNTDTNTMISEEDWIKSTHNGCGCSD